MFSNPPFYAPTLYHPLTGGAALTGLGGAAGGTGGAALTGGAGLATGGIRLELRSLELLLLL